MLKLFQIIKFIVLPTKIHQCFLLCVQYLSVYWCEDVNKKKQKLLNDANEIENDCTNDNNDFHSAKRRNEKKNTGNMERKQWLNFSVFLFICFWKSPIY